jgi:WD40 repeat protein
MTNPRKTPVRKHSLWAALALGFLVWSPPMSAQEPKLRATFKGNTEAIASLSFRPDGKMLASVSDGKSIKLWDVAKTK